jgi:septum formation protein
VQLILATGSPRRAELLTFAGFEFDVVVSKIDEQVRPGEPPATYVGRLAEEKAALVARLRPGATVIGADTAVVVDGDIFGKPESLADAKRMLSRLSGRTHEVVTGVSVCAGGRHTSAVAWTRVWMAPLDEQELHWYLDSGEWSDKAGAYAIQGRASRFVESIDGSYSNVVGLPVAVVHRLIKSVQGLERPAANR